MKKQLLIVHSSNDLYGASKIMLQIIDLLRQSYEISVILPYNGPLDDLIKKKGASLEIMNLGVFRKKYFNFFGLINRFFKIIKAVFRINSLIKKKKIDTVYSSTSLILAGAIAAKLNKIPSFFHIHEIPNNKFYSVIMGFFLSMFSEKIIVVSKSVQHHWTNFISKGNFKLIYNGIDFPVIEKSISKSKKIKILTIARILPYKGHIYLIEIAKKLLKNHKNIEFIIIGDAFKGYESYEKKLKSLVVQYALEDKIIFKGFKSNINKYLSESNFLLHPAIQPDPLPTVIFEAVYAKLPVIATNLGGAVEVLDNGNGGLLIPYNDSDCASRLISEYIFDFEKYNIQKEYAFSYASKNFSSKKFDKNIRETFGIKNFI